MSTLRSLLILLAIIATASLIGGFYGLRTGTNWNLIQMAPINEHVEQAVEITRLLELKFMESIDWDDAIYEGAIPSMLSTLDPHSTFLNPQEFKNMRENERGSYVGVGMQIINFRNKTIIKYPFPQTPAFEAGILPWDTIELLNGESVDDIGLTDLANRIKGPPGTSVNLSVSREGVESLIELDMVRNVIPRPTIPVQILFEDGTGYLRVNSFGDKTSNELDIALENFQKQGMRSLLLDLRDNKGGLLTEGVRVASKFLSKGQGVVSHSGRSSQKRHYPSQASSPVLDIPVVIMVNCNSASASEIVASALQDHDRALIVGTNTFGKGLVQSVLALPENTGMVLTTARYYSPSGRLIQRPYDNFAASEYFSEPCNEHYRPLQGSVHLTDKGRKVYELGGIAPDIVIKAPRMNEFQLRVQQNWIAEQFVTILRAEGYEMERGQEPSPEVIDRFLLFLNSLGVSSEPAKDPANRRFLAHSLTTHLSISYFDYDEGLRVQATQDPDIRQAQSLTGQAAQLIQPNGDIDFEISRVLPLKDSTTAVSSEPVTP